MLPELTIIRWHYVPRVYVIVHSRELWPGMTYYTVMEIAQFDGEIVNTLPYTLQVILSDGDTFQAVSAYEVGNHKEQFTVVRNGLSHKQRVNAIAAYQAYWEAKSV